MPQVEAIRQGVHNNGQVFARVKFSTFILVAAVFMAVALIYVWSRTQMTKLEYQVAEEISIREQLLEEQRRLKVEYATLKSPQRIEAIARDKLQMSYPGSEQVIFLK
ncbi:MAG: cell division protein FtsL [Syntrophales bacterium]